MGRAVLGKRTDDEFDLRLPKGQAAYVVTEVRYTPFEA